MYEWLSLSHVLRECNCHFAIMLPQERNVLYYRLGHRTWPGSRHRPQRGLHDALGPLGRAFLMPRPLGVVDYSPRNFYFPFRHPLIAFSTSLMTFMST